MDRWEYTTDDIFQSRLVLAAFFLKDCACIIELGPYKTSIASFLSKASVLAIEPLGNFLPNLNNLEVRSDLSEVDIPNSQYGFLALGLDVVPNTIVSLDKMVSFVHPASISVIGTATNYSIGMQQVEYILRHSGKDIDAIIDMDFSNHYQKLSVKRPGYPVFPKRHIVVLR